MQYLSNPNLYLELQQQNIIPRMEHGGLLGPGRFIDVNDKKLHKFPAIDPNRNWIYTNPNPNLYCLEYQARRLNIRFREKPNEPTRFVHTLNSTAIAIERALLAIIENYQEKDGSIIVPEVLVPYMNGLKKIKSEK